MLIECLTFPTSFEVGFKILSMPLPSVIAALGTVASMGLNNYFDRQQMNHQAHLNEDAMRQQFQFNDILNQNSYNRSFDQWLKEFNLENEYNLPLNQRSRMEAAGLNYLAMMQGQSGGSAGGTIPQSNPSVSSPSVGLPAVGMSQTASVDLPRAMATIADAYKSLSESSRQDAESELVKRTMSDVIRKYALDNEAQTMANAVSNLYTKWMTSAIYNQDGTVSSVMGVRKFNAEYQKVMEEVALLSSQAKSAQSQQELNDTMNDLQQLLKPVYQKDKAIAEGIMSRVKEYVNNIFRLQNMEISTGYTNAAANQTHAFAHAIEAQTGAKVGQSIIDLNTSNTRLNNIAADIREASSPQEISYLKRKFVQEAMQSRLLTQKDVEELQRLKNQNKTYWIDYGFDKLLRTSNEVRQWYNSVLQGKSADSNFMDGWNK